MANSNAKVTLKTYSDGYSIVVDGEESEPAEFGEILEMETADGRRFISFVEAEGKDIEAVTEFWAYEVMPVVDVPIEEEEEEDDDQGTGDDDEDDDGDLEEADQSSKGKVV